MSEIIPKIHETEQFYTDFTRSEGKLAWEEKAQLKNLDEIEALLKEYETLYQTKLKRSSTSSGEVISRKEVLELLSANRVEELKMRLQKTSGIPLPELLSPILNSLPELAKKLGKETPSVKWEGPTLEVNPEYSSKLEGIFTHLIGNSMDHGLKAGQPGTLLFRMNSREIFFQDSGRGLPLDKLKKKGLEQKAINPDAGDEEIAQIIFQSGLSTADQVTEVSGRGVGMDAVKSFIEELGGTITIQFTAPKSQDGFRPFGLLLSFPDSVMTADSISKAA